MSFKACTYESAHKTGDYLAPLFVFKFTREHKMHA